MKTNYTFVLLRNGLYLRFRYFFLSILGKSITFFLVCAWILHGYTEPHLFVCDMVVELRLCRGGTGMGRAGKGVGREEIYSPYDMYLYKNLKK